MKMVNMLGNNGKFICMCEFFDIIVVIGQVFDIFMYVILVKVYIVDEEFEFIDEVYMIYIQMEQFGGY